jgi:hypothetical protein
MIAYRTNNKKQAPMSEHKENVAALRALPSEAGATMEFSLVRVVISNNKGNNDGLSIATLWFGSWFGIDTIRVWISSGRGALGSTNEGGRSLRY